MKVGLIVGGMTWCHQQATSVNHAGQMQRIPCSCFIPGRETAHWHPTDFALQTYTCSVQCVTSLWHCLCVYRIEVPCVFIKFMLHCLNYICIAYVIYINVIFFYLRCFLFQADINIFLLYIIINWVWYACSNWRLSADFKEFKSKFLSNKNVVISK